MNVSFSFEPNDILKEHLVLSGEWNCPCLPRVGDQISSSLLMDWITPKRFYDALLDDEKALWDSWVAEDLEDDMSEEDAYWENLGIWLGNVGAVVSEITWAKMEDDFHVLISLKGQER